MATRKARNYESFNGMITDLHKHVNGESELRLSEHARDVLNDVLKHFVGLTIGKINDLMLQSKTHMQVQANTKVMTAVSLLFPGINPLTLKPDRELCTLLNRLLESGVEGTVKWQAREKARKEGKEVGDIGLFISMARVRKIMDRRLVRNKKTVRKHNSKDGKDHTRVVQTSVPKTALVFLTYVVQEVLTVVLEDACKLALARKKKTIKAEHVETACRNHIELGRHFSRSMFIGGRVQPTIHAARVRIPDNIRKIKNR